MSISVTKAAKLSVGVPTIITGVPEVVAKTAYSAPTGIGAIASKIVSVYADQAGDARTLALGLDSAGAYFGTSGAANQLEVAVASGGAAAITVASGALTLDASSVAVPSDLVLGTATITEPTGGARTFTLPATGGEVIIGAGTQSIGGLKTFTSTLTTTDRINIIGSDLTVDGDIQANSEYLEFNSTKDLYFSAASAAPKAEFSCDIVLTNIGTKITLGNINLGPIVSTVGSYDIAFPEVTGTVVVTAGAQTIGGIKTFNGTVIVPTPSADMHAATRLYVDDAIAAGGLESDFKESVRVAAAVDVPLTGSTPLVIDGVTVAVGNRVLLRGQTAGAENGIYTVAIALGVYTLTRAADANTSPLVTSGMFVIAEEGTNAGKGFALTTANPIVLDTTALVFSIFNEGTLYTAGTGLDLTGNDFSIDSTVVTTTGAQTITGVKTIADDTNLNVGTEGAYIKYLAATNDLQIVGKDILTLDTTSGLGYITCSKELRAAADIVVGTHGRIKEDVGTFELVASSGNVLYLAGDFIHAAQAVYADSGITFFGSPNDTNRIFLNSTVTVTGTRTINLPDISGDVVVTAGTQTIGGAKTFSGTVVVPTPSAVDHAATKGYVDAFVQGLDFHAAVRVASTANVPLTGSVPLVIDGVTLVAGNRILLKSQTSGAENGIYTIAIAGTYTLTRATDADDNTKLNNGTYMFVEEGTANGGYSFVCTTIDPITIDTTPLVFTIFSESQTYTAGNGLVLAAAEFAVASTIATVNFDASSAVLTDTINPHTPAGPVTVSSSLIAATINATGSTGLGNVSSAMTITGSAVTIAGPTVVNDQLRIAEDSAQLVLGVSASNNLVLTAATSGFAAQKTYTLPITTATSAKIAVVEGAAPAAASGYVLVNSGTAGLAQWTQAAIQPSVTATLTTTSTSAADLVTIATTTDRSYLMEITVVAKIAAGDMATYKIHVPVKNVADTVTAGSETLNNVSYDAAFNGLEIGYVVSGTDFKVQTTPAAATSTNWRVYVTYTYVD